LRRERQLRRARALLFEILLPLLLAALYAELQPHLG
jgi:hypothetical protein